MGSIVVYHNSPADGNPTQKQANRQTGMRYLGIRLDYHFKQTSNFKRAIIASLDDLVVRPAPDGNDYIVRYEWKKLVSAGPPPTYQDKLWRVALVDPTKPGSKLYRLTNVAGNPRGYLNLEIEKDEKSQKVFDMHVSIPRRAEDANVWNYFDGLLGDVGATANTNNNNYLRAALTFSRCA